MVSIEAEVLQDVSSGAGTSEFAWRQSFYLMSLTELSLGEHNVAVVVAAHPDDETLALGGTISALLAQGTTVIVVTATDGVQSRPGITGATFDAMKSRRQNEARAAITALGKGQPGNILNVQLHLPVGNLAGVETELVEHIKRFLGPDDLCFASWEFDGDPDREAAGRAAQNACRSAGARLLQFPIGMWRWGSVDDPTLPWRHAKRVSLDVEDVERKSQAISCYESQLCANLDDEDALAPLPPHEVAYFQRTFEVLFT